MYELAVGIKMLHMTFSTSHNCEIPLQLVYRLQQTLKFTYNELYSLKHVATHSSLISYFKILLIGVRTSRSDQKAPHDFLYIPQLWDTCTASVGYSSCKFTYNELYSLKHVATHSSLISYFKILLIGVRTSRWDQNAPHDFLYIPQLWDTCTASVQATAVPQI